MISYRVSSSGLLTNTMGQNVSLDEVSDKLLYVPHLSPHVLTFGLPKGERVNIVVYYSSHCWTRIYEDTSHNDNMRIMDGTRPRSFCPLRFKASVALPKLLENLPNNRLYLTRSDRNYGTYNTTITLEDGTSYTAYFTLKRKKGRFNGIRHKLVLFVESAYHKPQPEIGQKVKAATIISKALKGEKMKYFKR